MILAALENKGTENGTDANKEETAYDGPMELARDLQERYEKYNQTAPGYRKRSTRIKKLRRRARKMIADRL